MRHWIAFVTGSFLEIEGQISRDLERRFFSLNGGSARSWLPHHLRKQTLRRRVGRSAKAKSGHQLFFLVGDCQSSDLGDLAGLKLVITPDFGVLKRQTLLDLRHLANAEVAC